MYKIQVLKHAAFMRKLSLQCFPVHYEEHVRIDTGGGSGTYKLITVFA